MGEILWCVSFFVGYRSIHLAAKDLSVRQFICLSACNGIKQLHVSTVELFIFNTKHKSMCFMIHEILKLRS